MKYANIVMAALLGLIIWPSALSASETEEAMIGGLLLQLSESHGACRLNVLGTNPSSVALDLPAPCAFHRAPSAEIRTVQHADSIVLLIESSIPLPQSAGDCDTKLKAVAIESGNVVVSPHTDQVASCPPFQWDEKVFLGLF